MHYINSGLVEGRVGYIEGGGYGRWTIRSGGKVGDSYVYASCSERTAGAVDSLVWNDKEFINNWDHGRQLQVALTVQDYGECWNPTEAGGRSDGNGKETKSILTDIQAVGNVLGGVQQSHLSSHFAFQFATTVEHSEKCTISSEPAFQSSILMVFKWRMHDSSPHLSPYLYFILQIKMLNLKSRYKMGLLNTLQNTTVLPAYWVRGDDTQGGNSGQFCPSGTPSSNSEDTHPYDFKKLVTLGCFALENCIQFDITAEIGDSPDMPPYTGFAQLEAPTAYLNSDFTKVSYIDAATGYVASFDSVTKDETDQLVIIHTEDELYALGAVTKQRPPTLSGVPGSHYAYFAFGSSQFDASTYKWSVVIREDLKPGDVFEVTSFLCVGSLDMVVQCLMDVQIEMLA